MIEDESEAQQLELLGVIGFNGSIPNGLLLHSDRKSLIFGLGNALVIEDITSAKQSFLHGHSQEITCLASDRKGTYIATGQMTHMGFKAEIIVWHYKSRTEYARFSIHRGKIQALAFSRDSHYLFSLGGQDDGCVIVWSLAKKEPICGNPAQNMRAGITKCLAAAVTDEHTFVTAGDNTLRVWDTDIQNRKLSYNDITMGKIKRCIDCITVSPDDTLIFCGTSSGDILVVHMKTFLFIFHGPIKTPFSMGVTSLMLIKEKKVLVGTGEGYVSVVDIVELKRGQKKVSTLVQNEVALKAIGCVTSLVARGSGIDVYVGTDQGNMYEIHLGSMSVDFLVSSHMTGVNDIRFPK